MFSRLLSLGFIACLMIIGVPLFAIIYSLFKRFVSFLLERKGESSDTWDYASAKNPRIK